MKTSNWKNLDECQAFTAFHPPLLPSSIRPLNWAPLPSHNMKQKATNWTPEEYKTDELRSTFKANMRSAYFKPKVSSKPTKTPLKCGDRTQLRGRLMLHVCTCRPAPGDGSGIRSPWSDPPYADPFSREDGDEAYVVLRLKLEGCDSLRHSVC